MHVLEIKTQVVVEAMIGENGQLVTDELFEFEK